MFYRAVRALFRALAKPLFRFRVVGEERVPAVGAGVVVAFHRSWLDPACVGGALPRPVRFLIKGRVYRKPWARWFYRGMGSIAIDDGPHSATAALRAGLRALQAGELVGVFPEGAVLAEGQAGTIFPGAAMLAVRSGAPIIPVSIAGSARAWPRGRRWPGPGAVRVTIGAPVVQAGGDRREAVETMRRRVEEELRALEAAAPPP